MCHSVNLDSALFLESERSSSSWPGHITQSTPAGMVAMVRVMVEEI